MEAQRHVRFRFLQLARPYLCLDFRAELLFYQSKELAVMRTIANRVLVFTTHSRPRPSNLVVSEAHDLTVRPAAEPRPPPLSSAPLTSQPDRRSLAVVFMFAFDYLIPAGDFRLICRTK